MVIYYELVFLDNLVLNYLVLLISAKICAIKIKMLKLIVVSLIFSLISIIILKFNPSLLNSLIIKMLVIILLCIVFFGLSNLPLIIKHILIFSLVCFLISGVLFFFIGCADVVFFSQYIIYSNEMLRMMLYGILIIVLTYKVYIYANKTCASNLSTRKIQLVYKKQNIIVEGLMDTGNLLFDYYYSLPVILISKEKLLDYIDVDSNNCFDISASSIADVATIKAFKADYMIFEKSKTKYECVVGIIEKNLNHECIYNPNYFI